MGGASSNTNPGLGINSNMSAIAPALVQKIVNQTPFSQSGRLVDAFYQNICIYTRVVYKFCCI